MKYLVNFYNNVIKGTKADELFHLPGFWITLLFTVLAIVIYTDKWFFLATYVAVYLLYKINVQLDEKNRLEKVKIYDPEVIKVLDDIINDAFNEYFMFNEGFREDKHSISAVQEKEIMDRMVDLVSARLSESTITKLEAYYNKDAIPDIISSKIFMAITSYVVSNATSNEPNKPTKEQKILMDELSTIGEGLHPVQNNNSSPEAEIKYL